MIGLLLIAVCSFGTFWLLDWIEAKLGRSLRLGRVFGVASAVSLAAAALFAHDSSMSRPDLVSIVFGVQLMTAGAFSLIPISRASARRRGEAKAKEPHQSD